MVNKLADAFQNKKYISIYIGIKYIVYYSIQEKIITSGACGIRENLKKRINRIYTVWHLGQHL